MEREQIANTARQMISRDDLLNMLNQIKQEDMASHGLSNKYHPFTKKHITYYCNPNNTFHRYRTFEIKKKSGGVRKITSPRNLSYKYLLRCINELLKALYTPSKYAMGFTERRSVVTNASCHKGQNYIYNIDLKDFFPSIDQARVWKRLQLKPFNFPVTIASTIAGICSMREDVGITEKQIQHRYVLPQGAPTSPIITNMICDKLDHLLAGLANRFGLKYTRYADDITFSSMHSVYNPKGKFVKELQRIIKNQGFTINESKTRLQKKGTHQEVTGIIVSEKLNVTQKYVHDIRNILYIWDRYGYEIAYSKFFPKYKKNKGHIKKGIPDLVSVIDGKLMYLKMVKGDNDNTYLNLHEKFTHLINRHLDTPDTNNKVVSYLSTTPILEFENIHNVTINIEISLEKRTASYILDRQRVYLTVNKPVNVDDQKENLAVSTCLDSKGKTFKLLHRTDKKTVHTQPINIDINTLNKDLDLLLNNTI